MRSGFRSPPPFNAAIQAAIREANAMTTESLTTIHKGCGGEVYMSGGLDQCVECGVVEPDTERVTDDVYELIEEAFLEGERGPGCLARPWYSGAGCRCSSADRIASGCGRSNGA